ncbi:MAG TPA: pitrilysin family protein [Thermoanaerobaculia bacterium]|nr:pitrilysin family protein [Thermoanaerobaculia bacterium]
MISALDRSRPPRPRQPLPFRFPPFVHRPLLPGLDLYAAPLARAPLLSLELLLPGGAQADPAGRAGLATFTAALLDEGTATRSGPEIADWVERLGGALATSADWNVAYAACTVLSKHLRTGLDLLADVSLAPSFPDDEVERLRRRRRADLLRRRSQPAALADEALARALYGAGPYGYPLAGRDGDVATIRREEAAGFWRDRLCRGGATLVAAGDLDVAALESRAREVFAAWPAAAPPPPPSVVPQELAGIEVHLVDRAGAAQTELRVGHPGPPCNHPERIPLGVLNSLLGGKFTSRINLNLRERHGYTYGAHSSFSNRLGPGPFQVAAAVATEVAGAAVREVLAELQRLQQEPVAEEELADTVLYLEGVFPYTLQTVESVAQRLAQLAVFGLPDAYFDGYRERLRSVSREDLLRLAREHLRPDRLVVAAVGPADELRPQLADLGQLHLAAPPVDTGA